MSGNGSGKNLLLLLPFCVMRYESAAKLLQQDSDRLRALLQEYEVIRRKLENVLQGENRSGLYIDLVNLIIKISDYIFRKEKEVRKEIGEVMGGKVLELESERLRVEGKREGKREGEERMAVLINRLLLDGRSQEIAAAVNDKNVRKYLFSEYGL